MTLYKARHKRVIYALAKKNAYLRRKIQRIEEQRIRQENIADNTRALLRRIIAENSDLLSLLEEKNNELERFATNLCYSKAQLRGILEHSPLFISLKDPHGAYLLASPCLEKALGLSTNGITGLTDQDIFPAEQATQLGEMERQAMEKLKSVGKELSLKIAGQTRAILVTTYPLLNQNGTPWALGSIAMDITDKRRLQAEALHAAQLASLGEIAAGVAHEVNNPLNGIMNFAQLMKDECTAEGHCGLFPDLSDRIIKECDRVVTIVQRLLEMSRKPHSDLCPCSIPEIIDDCLGLMRAQLHNDSIDVVTRIERNLPMVYANRSEMQQVFMNLISNARHAMQGDSLPKLLEIDVDTFPRNGGKLHMIRVSVKDSGVGISREVLSRIFEPFFTTKSPGQGTGLGLSICKRIVDEHEGNLSVQTEPGSYTRFLLELKGMEY